MRIAITADLHWGHQSVGDEANQLLVQFLRDEPPDLLLLGGDLGTHDHFNACLQAMGAVPCPKAMVPGNHDIWVSDDDPRGDSLHLYEKHLPAVCAQHGVHYLDHAPLILPDHDLAIVGTMNWYDYSWTLERMKAEVPNWVWHLENKAFTRGRHNDRRFVRWVMDDVSFTRNLVATFEQQLEQSLSQVGRAVVMTHHPAFRGITFPRDGPAEGLDQLLWDALSGNQALEDVLTRHADRVPFVFSGHTHRATEARLGSTHGINIGGDYHFKRLLILDWPAGTITAHQFGDPNRRRV